MARKAIQIAIDTGPDVCGVYVLCDDGTIWALVGGEWELIENIPQMENAIIGEGKVQVRSARPLDGSA